MSLNQNPEPLPSQFGPKLSVDSPTRTVYFGTHHQRLTRIEFRLLELLLGQEGKLIDRQEILKQVWGADISVGLRTVDSHIVRLRRKLGSLSDQAPTIETVWGLGYRVRSTT